MLRKDWTFNFLSLRPKFHKIFKTAMRPRLPTPVTLLPHLRGWGNGTRGGAIVGTEGQQYRQCLGAARTWNQGLTSAIQHITEQFPINSWLNITSSMTKTWRLIYGLLLDEYHSCHLTTATNDPHHCWWLLFLQHMSNKLLCSWISGGLLCLKCQPNVKINVISLSFQCHLWHLWWWYCFIYHTL